MAGSKVTYELYNVKLKTDLYFFPKETTVNLEVSKVLLSLDIIYSYVQNGGMIQSKSLQQIEYNHIQQTQFMAEKQFTFISIHSGMHKLQIILTK